MRFHSVVRELLAMAVVVFVSHVQLQHARCYVLCGTLQVGLGHVPAGCHVLVSTHIYAFILAAALVARLGLCQAG